MDNRDRVLKALDSIAVIITELKRDLTIESNISNEVEDEIDSRDKLIASVVEGKSFVDVGALWLTHYEKLSVAHQHGASSVAAMDQFPKSSEWWQKLRERLGFPYQEISIDLMDYEGSFDVVNCSGVLYHSPSPLATLRKLYSMTDDVMILTTVYTEEVLESPFGKMEIPKSGMLFLPALTALEFSIIEHVFGVNRPPSIWGITEHVSPEKWDYNSWYWWWLFTANSVEAMLKVVNFKITDTIFQSGNIVTFKLEK
jgi:hypothetical protein